MTAEDVTELEAWAATFVDLDRRHGGGSPRVRALLADVLQQRIAPLLHGRYTDSVGRAQFGPAAILTGQAAYLSYDAGEHGTAQRHYTAALRLAKAAGGDLYGAHLIANMATQAIYLGQPRIATRLAAAALDRARRAPATVRARLYTTAASAYAIAGDATACTNALHRARRALKHDDASRPDWAGYFGPAHYAGAALRCYRDLGHHDQALRYADDALTLPPHAARTRALHTALIATTHLAAGDLDAASHIGIDALDLATRVRSRRADDRLNRLTHRLTRHRGTRAVDTYLDHAHA